MILETLKQLDKKYAQVIADELIKRIETDECLKNKMVETPKTLKGCIDYIKSEAKKQAEDGCAVMIDDDVFQLSVHYFLEDSLDFEPKQEPEKKQTKKNVEAEEQEEEAENDNLQEVKEIKTNKEIVKKKLVEQLSLFDF